MHICYLTYGNWLLFLDKLVFGIIEQGALIESAKGFKIAPIAVESPELKRLPLQRLQGEDLERKAGPQYQNVLPFCF